MPNIIDILARALSLRQETALNSITPNRAGGIMYDTLLVLNQMQLEGGSLLISKVYASVSAMEADTTPTSDLTGRALKPGQLVVIVTSDSSSSDMGSEYRFNGPGSWTYVGKVGGLPLDTVPTQSSTKGITSGGVYTALAAMKAEGYKYMGIATPGSGGTAPGTPNQPVFYIAGPGSYPNFGSITVASGYLGFIKYSSGSWTVESVAVGKDYDEQISELDGKISQLEAEVNGENTWETIDLSQIEKLSVSIASNTQKWAAVGGGSSQGGGFFPVTPGQTIKITPGTISSYFAVTKDTSHTVGTTPTYATGYSARVMVSGEMEFIVPEDGNYIFVMLVVSSGTVDDVYKKGTQGDGLIDRVSALEDDAEDMSGDIQSLSETVGTLENTVETQGGTIESLTTSVGDIEGEIDGTDEETEVPLDLSTYTVYKAYIVRTTNKWTDDNDAGCIMIPVNPGETYNLLAPSDKVGPFAVLTTNAHIGGTEPDYTETFPALIRLEAETTQEVIIPSDGHYLYAQTKSSSSGEIASGVTKIVSVHTDGIKDEVADLDERVTALEEGTPSGTDAKLSQLFESMPFAVDSDGWEIPTTPGMVYALKKATQAVQIVYNALANYPTLSSSTGASAGEHTGFPYSSTKQIRKFIGYEVSFRTFMTAVQNLYGMFYTEDINYSHEQSGYDYDYDGTNCGPYYGMVCSILTGYALGWEIPFDTDQFAYLSRIGELVKIKEQTTQGVHICDLIWYQGHTALVTGVQRDQWGNVINVQTTESLGAVHSTSYTAAQFDTYLHTTHDCIIYRPTKVYENTYTPSEFVAVRGESTPTPFVYNHDICHYAGDYSAMRSDQPTWINYTLGNYTGMKIYKGETLLTTITPDGSSHKVDVSSYMTGAGKYSACLTDGVNDSEYTHWQIVDAGCTYEDNGTKQKITFASSNGTPWWVQVCSSRGVAYCWYKPTTEDIANGYCELDLASMIAEQYTGTPVNTTFVRVMYKADYGGVVSAMVQR